MAAPPPGSDPYLDKTVAQRYRVLRKIGEGGMGVVYLAEHVLIEKKVAIKILSEDFARKADLVARFMQEAKAASRIGHENIVDITDFGETASGSVFFAMEFLDGHDLGQQIRGHGPMPFERARHIMNQICRALGAAHGKGIIHRDMKPENVYLIEREGKADFVKILDFGIAKMSSFEEGGARLTRTGMIFGTPEYMSPEQAKGDRPDHRVDIYAAGCILYEMLTGDVPFHADTFMGVLTKHMFETPVPPSKRAPAAGITRDVEAVVLRALAKDRERRFQTMKEMAVAMEACGGGDPALAWGSEPSQPHATGELAATMQLDSSPLTLVSPPPSGRTLVRRLALVGATGALLTLGVLGWRRMQPPVAPTVARPAPIRPAPIAAAAPPAAAPVEPRTNEHQITVHSQPSGAMVFSGEQLLGLTPFSGLYDDSAMPTAVIVKKAGYKDQTLVVVPGKDKDYVVELEMLRRGAPSRRAPVKSGATVQAPAPAPPPALTPESKPGGKLRDLKDPFAP